ncbi:MAG TPA: hypothetical protein VGW40_15445 [Allosphingosinicella sp.]|nr:hypothetical protein [Allosphingosinicella sp.]
MGRKLLALAALLSLPAAAQAQVDDPRAFVARSYAAYARAANDPPAEQPRAYSPRLRALFAGYESWARAHDDLVGSLDFDWWVNAQDWEISRVAVTQAPSGRGRRTVAARWTNYGRVDRSRFLFVRIGGRWYLDDVVNGNGREPDGWTLSALLRQRP